MALALRTAWTDNRPAPCLCGWPGRADADSASAGILLPAQDRGTRKSPACARLFDPPARTEAAAAGSAGPRPRPKGGASELRVAAAAQPGVRQPSASLRPP